MKYFKYLLFVLMFFISSTIYAQSSIEVSSWKELASAINSKKYNEIILKESGTFIADSKITISNREITIIPEYGKEINIVRKNSKKKPFLDTIFDIKTHSYITIGNNDGKIIMNGELLKDNKPITTKTPINIDNSTLFLNNISFENNTTNQKGGTIYAYNSTLNINNSSFINNIGVNGGAIYSNKKCTVIINNSLFEDNKAKLATGGAIYASGTYDIINCTFNNNEAYTYGGAIIVKNTTAITSSTFTNNVAINRSAGAIKVDGKLTLNDSTLINNTASILSGGVDYRHGQLIHNNNNIVENNKVEDKIINIAPDQYDIRNQEWISPKEEILEEIPITKIKSYSGNTQGFTITDDFIVLSKWEQDNEATKLYIINKNNYKIINTVIIKNTKTTYSLGHVNDMTYDKNTGYIYSYTSTKSENGNLICAKFKIDKKGKLNSLEYFDSPAPFNAIAYDYDDDYIIMIYQRIAYIYDTSFNLVNVFNTPTPLTTQGLAYYKGHIYFSAFEAGCKTDYQDVFNLKEKSSNLIYVYDLEGNYKKTLYIPNTKIWGEIESIDFLDNGELILSYNYNGITLFKTNYLNQVKEIKIGSLPNKTEYEKGEYLDLRGLSVHKIYNNETYEVINKEDLIIPDTFDNTKYGKQKITFNFEGETLSFNVNVVFKLHLKELMAKAGTKLLDSSTQLFLIVFIILITYYILVKKNKFYTKK